MNGWIGAFSFLGQDASVLNKKVKPGTARRTLAFAAPYSGLLASFLLVVILGATVGIASPLIFGCTTPSPPHRDLK
jgi:ATP-binding cassette, subfamily B, bacterial